MEEMKNGGNKNSRIEKDTIEIASVEKSQLGEKDHGSGTGRPDINEISKRNEETEKQERKSFYITTGIIVLLITVVVFLVYFFS